MREEGGEGFGLREGVLRIGVGVGEGRKGENEGLVGDEERGDGVDLLGDGSGEVGRGQGRVDLMEVLVIVVDEFLG